MKTAAILEDFNGAAEKYPELIQIVREQTGADYLVAVMTGDFLENGLPACTDKYSRAERAVSAGVDMVLEIPVCAGLSDLSTKVFSGVSLLKRLYSVDDLVILCHGDVGEQLAQIGRQLFLSRKPEDAVPEAAQILADPVNRYGAEIVKATYQFYWVVQPDFLDIGQLKAGQSESLAKKYQPDGSMPDRTDGMPDRTDGMPDCFDRGLAEELHRLLWRLTAEERGFGTGSPSSLRKRLYETPDGTAELCECFLSHLEDIQKSGSFEHIIRFLQKKEDSFPGMPAETIRIFLIKLLIGMDRGSVIICGLRANCPHGRILGLRDESAPGYRRIREKSWVTLLPETTYGGKETAGERTGLDECGQILAGLDDRAHELYVRVQYPAAKGGVLDPRGSRQM